MNLKEIVNRPNETPIQEDEAYFILKEYVRIRKGVEINPTIDKRFGIVLANHEVLLMHNMLNVAIGWLRDNPKKI